MQPAVVQQRATPPVAAVHVHPLPEVAALHPDVMSAEAAAEGAEDPSADQEAGSEAYTHRAARRAKRLAKRLARQAAQALQVGWKGSSQQHRALGAGVVRSPDPQDARLLAGQQQQWFLT